jgi:tetratricopeptide (TPR) repeat protein
MYTSNFCLLCAVLIIASGFAEAQKEVILYNMGNNFYYQGEINKSIESYDQAIQIRSDYADAWYNRGIALMNLTKYNESIKSFDKAIEYYKNTNEIDPNLAKAWYNEGLAFKALGKTTEANAAFTKAEKLGYKC